MEDQDALAALKCAAHRHGAAATRIGAPIMEDQDAPAALKCAAHRHGAAATRTGAPIITHKPNIDEFNKFYTM